MGVMPLVLLYFIKPLWKIDHCVKSILKCLFKFTNDALQHLQVLQIHRVIIIDIKKPPTYRDSTMRPPTIACAFMVSSCRTFEFGTLFLA